MGSVPLETILRRARALCIEAGLDPDEPSRDGTPDWFRFLGEAKASFDLDQENLCPLEALDALSKGGPVREARLALSENAPDKSDPVKRLEELYERETGENATSRRFLAKDAANQILMDIDSGNSGLTPAPKRGYSDPLEALRALEAALRADANLEDISLEIPSSLDYQG